MMLNYFKQRGYCIYKSTSFKYKISKGRLLSALLSQPNLVPSEEQPQTTREKPQVYSFTQVYYGGMKSDINGTRLPARSPACLRFTRRCGAGGRKHGRLTPRFVERQTSRFKAKTCVHSCPEKVPGFLVFH